MRYLALLLLNTWDGYATSLGILSGLVSEANPLLRDMAHASPMSLFWVKFTIVNLFIGVLYQTRTRRVSHYATLPLLGIYGGIALIHCYTLGIL